MACSICLHISRAQIDADLMAGAKLIPTAQRYGLSKSAVARHREGCLAPRVAAAAALVQPHAPVSAAKKRHKAIATGQATPTPSEALDLAGLLGRMSRSMDRLDAAAEKAATDNAVAALAAASAQLHRGIEIVAKLAGIGAQPAVQTSTPATIIIQISPDDLPASKGRVIDGGRDEPLDSPFELTLTARDDGGVLGDGQDDEDAGGEVTPAEPVLRIKAPPPRRLDLSGSGLSDAAQESIIRDLAVPDFVVPGNRHFGQ
jgi:hypothetical protein